MVSFPRVYPLDIVPSTLINDIEAAVEDLTRQVFNVKERIFGAVGNGIANDTAAIQSAIGAASAAGGGTVYLPSGTYAIDAVLAVPDGVNVTGAGHSRTASKETSRLLATAAGAQLKFGDLVAGTYGGPSGGFIVDGNDLATNPFFVGMAVGRRFDSIYVVDAASGGAGVTVAGTQNCLFTNLKIEDCAGDGLVIDRGAGSNGFHTLGVANAGGWAVKFQESGVALPGLVAYPIRNLIFDFMIEHFSTGGSGLVLHEAGHRNAFAYGTFSLAGVTSAKNIAQLDAVGTVAGDVTFEDVWWFGVQAHVTALDVAAAITCTLTGNHLSQHLLRFYHIEDTAVINEMGVLTLNNVTSRFVSPTGTALAENTIVRSRHTAPIQVSRPAAGDTVLVGFRDGDTAPRYSVNEGGTQLWGPGNAAQDTNFYRWIASWLRTDHSLAVGGTFRMEGPLDHDGTTAGFYGVAPVTRATVAGNATDLATALTLVNDLKAKLIALGLVQ